MEKPDDPVFPPLLKGHAIDGAKASDGAAIDAIESARLGAGDVLWRRGGRDLDLSIILEPDRPFETCTELLPLAMVACGDCLGALAPPQVAVTFDWPDIVCVNGAPAGRIRLRAGPAGGDPQTPQWLIVTVNLKLKRGESDPEPGHKLEETTLADEGCTDLTLTRLIESYTRHFLTWLNNWQDEGFAPVRAAWTAHCLAQDKTVRIIQNGRTSEGRFTGLDEHGNALLQLDDGEFEVLYLADDITGHSFASEAR